MSSTLLGMKYIYCPVLSDGWEACTSTTHADPIGFHDRDLSAHGGINNHAVLIVAYIKDPGSLGRSRVEGEGANVSRSRGLDGTRTSLFSHIINTAEKVAQRDANPKYETS